jgi:protein SCO1/2
MIQRVARAYRVRYEKVYRGADKSDYFVDHTAAIFHMGPDGSYLGRFPYETSPAEIAEKVKQVMDRSAPSAAAGLR